jgi:hypothetical protein
MNGGAHHVIAPEAERDVGRRPFWIGFGIAFALHGLQGVNVLVALYVCSSSRDPYCAFPAGLALGFFGISQFVYQVPASIIAVVSGHRRVARGIEAGAKVSFFLNLAWLLISWTLTPGVSGWRV